MKLKIIHITDSLELGGAERVVFELASRMNGQDFEVAVVQLHDSEQAPMKLALEKAGVHVYTIPKTNKFGFGLQKMLVEFLNDQKPHIVHTHLFASDIWGARAAEQAHVPVIISTEHGTNPDHGWLKQKLKRKTHLLRKAVVAVSDAVVQATRKTYPNSTAGKVSLIPNGINLDRFANAAKLKESQPANDVVKLSVVGRLEAIKGHTDLINSLPLLQNNFHLDIVGAGSLRSELDTLVTKLGLQDKVTFTGKREDVENVYAETDIVIVPSKSEGLGLVAIEAMASKCAVLASAVDGLLEVIETKKTGLLVDFSNPIEVAEQLDKLIADKTLRESLGAAAQPAMQERFSAESMIASYTDLYKSLLKPEK